MATEKRLIDANEAIERAKNSDKIVGSSIWETGEVVEFLEDSPIVEAVEVVHGRWEPRTDVIGFVQCSVCCDCNVYDDWADGKKWNYCPNCGADMRGDGNG